ncbi:MAG TPA: nitroreductase/quinone reductase family protein [Actinomycetota bacterium]
MLIAIRGRRSGAQYTFPVQYAEGGGAIWVFPGHHERKTWWRNLASESSVTLHLRGHDVEATAEAFSGKGAPSVVEEGLYTYLRRFRAVGRRMGVVSRNGKVDQERLGELAKSRVIVRIEPLAHGIVSPRIEGVHERPEMPGLLGPIRRHPLGAFYALTFLLSWGYWVPNTLAGGKWSHSPGLLGPAISAIVVSGVSQGSGGLRGLADRILRWRVHPRWYLWVAFPVGLALVVAGVLSLGGGEFPSFAEWSEMAGFAGVSGWAAYGVILVVNGFGEETGWRGFATPAFRRRHNEITSSLLVAIPWALWHLPTFFIDSGYRGFPLFFLPGWLLGVFALAVVMTWIYEGARSSILIAVLMHLSLNVATTTAATEGTVSAVVTMAVVVSSIIIAARWRAAAEGAGVHPGRSGYRE